ncbi:hypothetical protein FACS18942_05560 [Planctomycetales bacterium]|nr:hypothetical protein FACS18942_05560 [Planctomycetales bacterium]GHT35427.1 hypothetical protein FACS189427_04670 [Planctomycetales bacterium]
MKKHIPSLLLCNFVLLFLTAAILNAQQPQNVFALNVKDFGAVNDGQTDNTAAFQKALDAAAAHDTQTVFVPRGNYRFDGSLNVPAGVTLKGVWETVPSHSGIRNKGRAKPTDDGTTFLVYGGKEAGKEAAASAPAFITLQANSTLRGVCIYYPEQKEDDIPVEYPWTIVLRGDNIGVLDCELLNPYRAIDATHAGRHLIRNIHGQPLRLGIYVDAIYDIGRIENVHWNPWWSMKPKLFKWQMENGEGFVFGRTDWHYVHNTFCFGYNTGYRFIETKNGVCNGNFLGIGADDCYSAVVVEQSAPFGILITNGEFVSFHGPEPTMIRVAETNRGAVRFSNCAFWGPCRQIAVVNGTATGMTGFSDCTFVQWGFKAKEDGQKGYDRSDNAAIQILGGNAIIRGNDFQENKNHILLGEKVKRAVITGNIFRGTQHIENNAGEKPSIVIKDNAADE